jgi:hypothetical protein
LPQSKVLHDLAGNAMAVRVITALLAVVMSATKPESMSQSAQPWQKVVVSRYVYVPVLWLEFHFDTMSLPLACCYASQALA